jgi:hypothetical protein
MTFPQRIALWGASNQYLLSGAVAQLGERLICIQEVVGSIPISSTKRKWSLDAISLSVNGSGV